MNGKPVHDENQGGSMNVNKGKQRNGGSRTGGAVRAWVGSLAMAALMALSAWTTLRMCGCGADAGKRDGRRPEAAVPGNGNPAAQAAYNAEVQAALERYQKRIGLRTKEFAAALEQNAPARFAPARAAIPGILAEFATMSAMGGVVKDAALDKIRGGDRLERRIARAVQGPFLVPCARAGDSLVADGEAFAGELEKEFAAFCEELGAAGQKWPEAVPAEFSASALLSGVDRTGGKFSRMPVKTAFVAGEVLCEGIFFRSTLAAIRRLVLKMAGKTVAKATATAIAPAADGPFPVGDILAVGGAVWTAWDLYELKKVLPREIGKELNRSVAATQRDTVRQVEEAARKTAEAYRAAGDELAKEVSAKTAGNGGRRGKKAGTRGNKPPLALVGDGDGIGQKEAKA